MFYGKIHFPRNKMATDQTIWAQFEIQLYEVKVQKKTATFYNFQVLMQNVFRTIK